MAGLLEGVGLVLAGGAAGGFKAWGESATDRMKADAIKARDENLARLTSARDKERDKAGAAEADRMFKKETDRSETAYQRRKGEEEKVYNRRMDREQAKTGVAELVSEKKTAAAEKKADARAKELGLKADRAYALEVSKARTKFMTDYYNSVTGDGLRPITPEQKKAGENLAAKYFPMETDGKAGAGAGKGEPQTEEEKAASVYDKLRSAFDKAKADVKDITGTKTPPKQVGAGIDVLGLLGAGQKTPGEIYDYFKKKKATDGLTEADMGEILRLLPKEMASALLKDKKFSEAIRTNQ